MVLETRDNLKMTVACGVDRRGPFEWIAQSGRNEAIAKDGSVCKQNDVSTVVAANIRTHVFRAFILEQIDMKQTDME